MKKITFALALLIATASFAADAPKPNPKLKELEAFAGAMTCKGTAFASEWGPEHPTAANVSGHWTQNNFWLEVNYKETKTAKNPTPYGGYGFWGYDEQSKKFVSGWIDNTGGYQTAESTGWDGDSMTWVGPYHAAGMTMNGRDVFTKKGKSGLAHTFELEMNGKWTKVAEESCTKSSK